MKTKPLINKFSYKRLFSAILFFSFLLGACSKPPMKELEAAQEALNKAKEAEANIYAEDLYKIAIKHFNSSKKFASKRKWRKVKAIALETIPLVDAAIAAVQANKAKAKEEAEALLPRLKGPLEKYSKKIKKRGKRRRMNEQQKGQQKKNENYLASLGSFMESAQSKYDEGKYTQSISFSMEVLNGFEKFDELLKKTK